MSDYKFYVEVLDNSSVIVVEGLGKYRNWSYSTARNYLIEPHEQAEDMWMELLDEDET